MIMTDWIPITERLPEPGNEVLVSYDFEGDRYVYLAEYYSNGFVGYDDEYLMPEAKKIRKAVAWLPKPEPWKGEVI